MIKFLMNLFGLSRKKKDEDIKVFKDEDCIVISTDKELSMSEILRIVRNNLDE